MVSVYVMGQHDWRFSSVWPEWKLSVESLGELAILSGLSRAVFCCFFQRGWEGEADTIQIFLKVQT